MSESPISRELRESLKGDNRGWAPGVPELGTILSCCSEESGPRIFDQIYAEPRAGSVEAAIKRIPYDDMCTLLFILARLTWERGEKIKELESKQ